MVPNKFFNSGHYRYFFYHEDHLRYICLKECIYEIPEQRHRIQKISNSNLKKPEQICINGAPVLKTNPKTLLDT